MPSTTIPSKKQILINLIVAICAAALVLMFAVLPAEYDIDPTGLGKVMGLTQLATDTEEATETFSEVTLEKGEVAYSHEQAANDEIIEILLKPFDEVEYKATLPLGEPLLYSWSTSQGEVYYDFHGEPSHPENFEEGFFQSYEAGEATNAHGSFITPFEGRHGWYWLNYNEFDVTIRLHATGYYGEIFELFRSNQETGPYPTEE